jgi:glyoxylase-like metal-dependent hydrolase (beta-lactamase superfamily II)
MTPQMYEVYAIKYATREAKCSEHFYGVSHLDEDYSMPMDYFIWLVKSENHTIVVDTGFNEKVARERNKTFLRCPVTTLERLGVDPHSVSMVVLTHMHYDHAGNLDRFPNATIIVQETEMAFWTSKYASKQQFRYQIETNDVLHLVKENLKGKVLSVNGNKEILPGIHLYKTGGHSTGLQVLKINTVKGDVILASDASHFYKNLNENRPFSIVTNLAEMYDSFHLLNSLTDSPNLIIPGHDPLVMDLFSVAKKGLEGIAVRIA